MKKAIAVILALMTLLYAGSLSGCGKKEETKGGGIEENNDQKVTEEMLDNSLPNEYVMEKLEAGREVQVGFSLLVVNFFTEMLASGVQNALEPLGCTFSYTDADGDVSQQITQMENYVQMGCSLLVIQPADGSLVKDTVLAAQDAGTDVLIYGVECDYDTCMVRIDTYESATQQMKMAQAWVDQRYPDAGDGEIHVMITTNDSMPVNQLKGQAYRDFADRDPRMTITYCEDGLASVDAGYDAIERALSVDPQIRLIVPFDIGAAIGISNYIVSNSELDPDEFAVVAAGEDSATKELIEKSKNNEAVLRGTVLDGETPYDALALTAVMLLKGETTAPYEMLQPIYCISGFGYSYDSTAAN